MDSPQTGGYQRLGHKTLWLFIAERSTMAVIALLLSAGAFVLFNSNIPTSYPLFGKFIVPVHEIVRYAALFGFLIFSVSFLLAILVGWIVYVNYQFFVGDDALKIKRGILSKEEIAIPYRQIQNINIERDLSYQVLGLSRLVIETAGHDEKPGEAESEGILPAIDRNLAESLQAELLKRANIEKVVPANQ